MRAVGSSSRPARVSRVASAISSCIPAPRAAVPLGVSGILEPSFTCRGLEVTRDPVSQRPLDRRARPEGAQHHDGLDGGKGQLRRDVVGDARQPEDLDLEPFPGGADRLQICAGEVLNPQYQRLAGDRLANLLGVVAELVADRGPYEVRAIGIETL